MINLKESLALILAIPEAPPRQITDRETEGFKRLHQLSHHPLVEILDLVRQHSEMVMTDEACAGPDKQGCPDHMAEWVVARVHPHLREDVMPLVHCLFGLSARQAELRDWDNELDPDEYPNSTPIFP